MKDNEPTEIESTPSLSASVQVLPLPPGLYLFSVKAASNSPLADSQLRVPAMHVGLGPGVRPEQIEFISGPSTYGAWLFSKEDALVAKIAGTGAKLILTSVRGPGGEILTIKIERLDTRTEEDDVTEERISPLSAVAASRESMEATPPATKRGAPISPPIVAHIRSRGDMNFTDTQWAGRVAPGLWVEAFAIRPLEGLASQDIEYKGLTGSGFETPWVSEAAMCGTRGLAVPLVGFAVRLKTGQANVAAFDCEYSGYFKSGSIVGPMRNGAPCRSTVANDPLEGLQIRILVRNAAPVSPVGREPAGNTVKTTVVKGPYFGRYREHADFDVRNNATSTKTSTKSKLDGLSNNKTKTVSNDQLHRESAVLANRIKRPSKN